MEANHSTKARKHNPSSWLGIAQLIDSNQAEQGDCGDGSSDTILIHDRQDFTGNVFECRAIICPEEEGGFCAFAVRLPGVASQGESVTEAIENLREAFSATIRTYLAEGMDIPWEDAAIERPAGTAERWILVDV